MTQGSTIRVGTNVYSVPSRLIGEKVDVHVMAECLEVWFGAVLVERVPRLRGRNKYLINYRHVIDWLVRKPGAFAAYRYQDALFPTSRFRRVYDVLREQSPAAPPRITFGSWNWRPSSPRPGSTPSWAGSWSGSVPITPTVVEEQLRHDLGLPRAMEVVIVTTWTCRPTTCYSKPGRISHYQIIRRP